MHVFCELLRSPLVDVFVSSDQKWECFASKQVDENSLNRGACCYDGSCRNFHGGVRGTKVRKGLQKEGEKGDKKLFSVKRHLWYSGGRAHMCHHDKHHLASAWQKGIMTQTLPLLPQHSSESCQMSPLVCVCLHVVNRHTRDGLRHERLVIVAPALASSAEEPASRLLSLGTEL